MKEPAAVVFRVVRDNDLFVCVGKLIYESEQPFAEPVQVDEETPSPLPKRIRLYPNSLELIDGETAGRPAWYLHRGIVAVPNQPPPKPQAEQDRLQEK